MTDSNMNPIKLYWVEADDHAEDWFVVAENKSDAELFFAEYEGYDRVHDEVLAVEVCIVPDKVRPNVLPCHPDEQLIEACDGTIATVNNQELYHYFIKEDLEALGPETRMVKIKDQVFVEGNLAQVTVERMKRNKHTYD